VTLFFVVSKRWVVLLALRNGTFLQLLLAHLQPLKIRAQNVL
jgi:hypothetical protein